MSEPEPPPQPLPPPHQRPSGWLPPSLARATPSQPPPGAPPGQPWPAYPPPPRRRTPVGAVVGLVVALGLVPLLVLVMIAIGLTAGTDRDRTTTRTRSTPGPSTPARTVETVWKTEPGVVRPDLPGAEFVPSIDGSFDDSYVYEVGPNWLALTGDTDDQQIALHAIDPATGKQRWQRELDGALCVTEATSSGLLCASVLDRDDATGLGTRWRLHLLDPATGRDRATRDIDGWLTAVHLAGTSFVVVEQRQPAPQAVVRAFAAKDLTPRWERDLSREPGHAALFSENRIIVREEPKRPGLALDRPRFRDVGNGLVALWSGMQTAFIDRDSGELVMMPHCSRLVDDGTRLWCNEVDGATAYSYAGKKLVRVTGPRLAFPRGDVTGADRDRPVFIDSDGAGVSVDPRTGKVGAVYTPPGRGSAFGTVTMPGTYTVGTRTFLIGAAGTLLLDPKADKVTWRNAGIKVSDVPVLVGADEAVIGRRDVVDLTSGETVGSIRLTGSYTAAIGDQIASYGSEEISVIRVR